MFAQLWRSPLRVAAPCSNRHDPHRIEVELGSDALWFESLESVPARSIEALGCAFTIPSAASGKKLVFESAPDPVWLANAQQAQAVAAKWWGYSCPGMIAPPEWSVPVPTAANRHTALCFTGGVDSFYTLLRGDQRVERLLFVLGYDIELTDLQRAQAAEASVRQVAAELGVQVDLVRTNLRTHKAFRAINWEHAHGGALAAIGHLLSDHVNQLLISASYPHVFNRPWGTHWELDPFWSSSRLAITHAGAEKWRSEKLAALINEPLVRQHLRVCWENRSPSGNCGECEKCLRTMLVLDGHGCLDQFPVFPAASTLAANLERLGPLKNDLIRVYAGFLEMDLSARVRPALAALVDRSTRHANGTSEH